MANKRMISADVCSSDSFLTMSHKSQALYFQCILNADDDGLVDNTTILLRSLELKRTSLQELVAKRFLLDLGDDIYCIKHWMINNNKIQRDRYKATKYPEKLDLLILKGNQAYTMKEKGDFSVNDSLTGRYHPVNGALTVR